MGLSVWRETSKKLTVYRVCYTPIETLLRPITESLGSFHILFQRLCPVNLSSFILTLAHLILRVVFFLLPSFPSASGTLVNNVYNKPFASCFMPRYESKAWCRTFYMKMVFKDLENQVSRLDLLG